MKINIDNIIETKNKSYISPRLELIEIELEEVIAESDGYMGDGSGNDLGKQQAPVMEKSDYRTSLGGGLSL